MRGVLLALLAASAAAAATRPVAWPWHAKVDIVIYGEALCPYCASYLAKNAEALAHDYAAIARVRFVPWGNARARPNGTVVCQHGETEVRGGGRGAQRRGARHLPKSSPRPLQCALNRVYACLIEAQPTNWLPVIACASAHYPDVDAALDKCARRSGVDAAAARECAAGARGAALEAAAMRETDALVPAHAYVPWVVVDDLALGSTAAAAGVVACAAWRGARPQACLRAPPGADGDLSVAGSAAAAR